LHHQYRYRGLIVDVRSDLKRVATEERLNRGDIEERIEEEEAS
jgi:hypothetical protein